MNEDDKNQLRSKIRRELEQLEANLPSLEEAARPVSPDSSIGRLTRQDAMQAQQLSKNSLARAKQRIPQLERALTEIDENAAFGLCAECEEPIPLKRLLLMPEVKTCIRCGR